MPSACSVGAMSSLASSAAPPPPPRVRAPLLAASFLLPSAGRGAAQAQRPTIGSGEATATEPHGHAAPFSAQRMRAFILTQPLNLTAGAAAAEGARGAHTTSLAPFSSSAASASRSAAAAAASSSVDPRDVQMEVGCSLALLRAQGIISGSLVEIEAAAPMAHTASPAAAAAAAANPPRVLARIQAVDIDAQQFRGKRRWKAESAATAATAACAGSASTLLITPSLHFHLFAATAPAAHSASADALSVRIRRFLPAVPGRADGMVHTLRPEILTWLPTASAVSVARIATPSSSSAAFASSDAQLSAVFTRTLSDGSKAPRRRIMFAGASTIIAVPLSVRNKIARRSWLLRPPPSAAAAGSAESEEMEDEIDDEEEQQNPVGTAGSDPSDDSSGHFLPPSIMRLLYFRITSVTPSILGGSGSNSYFVIDPNVTTLVQEGSVHARVDYASEWFLTRAATAAVADERRRCEQLSPLAGLSTLRDTFERIRALFLPSLLSSAAAASGSSSSTRALPSFVLASSLLLTGPRRSCKRKLASAVACSLGVHYLEANFFTLLGASSDESAIQSNLSKLFARAKTMAPCVLHLRRMGAVKAWLASMQKEKDVTLTANLRDLMESVNAPSPPSVAAASSPTESVYQVLVLGSCETLASMPASLRNLFLHSLSLTPPSLDERRRIVSHVLHATNPGTVENETAVVTVADTKAGTKTAASSHSHDRPIDSTELAEAAAEVNSIVVRSQLTASPPAPSSATAAPAMNPRALAQTIAEKSAGMSVGDVEHFVAAIAKQAVERQMKEEDEARAEEKKRRAAAQRKAASADEDGEERKESDVASSALLLASASSPLSPSPSPPLHLTGSDIDSALSAHSARASASSGTMSSAPNVKWSDVGGLENVKREVMESIELPLKFPELFKAGIKKRAGILLYGPPGTGQCKVQQDSLGNAMLPAFAHVDFLPLALLCFACVIRQDHDRQSRGHRVPSEFHECQRTRAAQHVHRRK